jgi:superoxide dismutase, Fe-Mn family
MTYELPELTYKYNALEPNIDEQTMKIHHTKHHQAYIDKANAALEQYPDLKNMSVEELLKNIQKVPEMVRLTLRNNAGGHANHSFFWKIMKPDGGGEPKGGLRNAIDAKFGSLEHFRQEFSQAAKDRFGSGWAWLVVGKDGELKVYSTPNQDSPLMEGDTPVLGLDVWEHAYYLKYQNKRPDYVEAFWKVVNWEEAEKRFNESKG